MSTCDPHLQKPYWEEAGRKGYANYMYNSSEVQQHIIRRQWSGALDIARLLGLTSEGHVLDLGCGDGSFANSVLSQNFRAVDGLDFAEPSILRARSEAPRPEVRFELCDLTAPGALASLRKYDGAFMMGILHHVKPFAPAIVSALGNATSRVVALEPNGDNLLRKLLEHTPNYRAAGEDSFHTREIIEMFAQAGFENVHQRSFSLFPNFTPGIIYKSFGLVEPFFETTPLLRALCTAKLYGFQRKE
jgi:2-polyprenyl-3-methyl-5-hydroxy-6-metoxy-1,4-benzoquinol methylase